MASSIINSDDGSVSGTTGLKTTGGDDGALEIQSVGTKYMTVAAGGDISFYEDTGTTAKFFWDASAESLRLGTGSGATPNTSLDNLVIDGSSNVGINILTSNTGDGWIGFGDPDDNFVGGWKYNHGSNYLASYSNNAERMRIDSNGNVLVDTTETDIGYTASGEGASLHPSYIQVARNSSGAAVYLNKLGNTGDAIRFYQNTSQIGSISLTSSATSYNTSSDYRLKEDWQPMSGSIDRLKALNPVNFAWKADGSRVDGFLAHEAAEVVPEAVSGEKDAVEAIGNITDAEGTVVQENVTEPAELSEGQTWTKTEDRPVYQGIDQSKLTPLLTAALQDTLALVEAQATKIEALETRIAALEA